MKPKLISPLICPKCEHSNTITLGEIEKGIVDFVCKWCRYVSPKHIQKDLTTWRRSKWRHTS